MQASVLINGHHEGALLSKTIRSALEARRHAESYGHKISILLVLDKPDWQTRKCAAEFNGVSDLEVKTVKFGNLGASRSFGVESSKRDWIFFLDGDDLVSPNWFSSALSRVSTDPLDSVGTVFHTEYFIGFGASTFFRKGLNSGSEYYHPLDLIADWFYCNNLFVNRELLMEVPIDKYDHSRGFGAEDWHWSMKTAAAGIKRECIPETAYFYRLTDGGASLGSRADLLPKKSLLFTSSWINSHAKEFLFAKPPVLDEHIPECVEVVSKKFLSQADKMIAYEPALESVVRAYEQNENISFGPRSSRRTAISYASLATKLYDSKPVTIIEADGLSYFEIARYTDYQQGAGHQVVLLVSKENTSFINELNAIPNVIVFDISRYLKEVSSPAYVSRLFMRILIQFKVRNILISQTTSPWWRAVESYPKVFLSSGARLIANCQLPRSYLEFVNGQPEIQSLNKLLLIGNGGGQKDHKEMSGGSVSDGSVRGKSESGAHIAKLEEIFLRPVRPFEAAKWSVTATDLGGRLIFVSCDARARWDNLVIEEDWHDMYFPFVILDRLGENWQVIPISISEVKSATVIERRKIPASLILSAETYDKYADKLAGKEDWELMVNEMRGSLGLAVAPFVSSSLALA